MEFIDDGGFTDTRVAGNKNEFRSASAYDTVEGRKPIFLDTFYIPQKVADVLKIKVDTLLFQPSSLASPVSEEMRMRTFQDLVAVRSAESFLFRCLCTRK